MGSDESTPVGCCLSLVGRVVSGCRMMGDGLLLLGDDFAVAEHDDCSLGRGGRGRDLGVGVVGADQFGVGLGLEFKAGLRDLPCR